MPAPRACSGLTGQSTPPHAESYAVRVARVCSDGRVRVHEANEYYLRLRYLTGPSRCSSSPIKIVDAARHSIVHTTTFNFKRESETDRMRRRRTSTKIHRIDIWRSSTRGHVDLDYYATTGIVNSGKLLIYLSCPFCKVAFYRSKIN
jgi:hypothetical protein